MPIEIGRKLTPEEETEMLAELEIFREVVATLADILAPEDQPHDASPTKPAGEKA